MSGPIGLLGGSFDPVHAGHCQLARDAQAALGLQSVRFVPAGQPWQKGTITAAGHRCAMLRLALAGEACWQIDAREIDRPGPTYTIDTLQALRAEVGAQVPLVWILGYDQLLRLDTWHHWRELLGLAHIAYAQRAGTETALAAPLRDYVAAHQVSPAALATRPAGGFVPFAMQPVHCSATGIRQALERGDAAGAQDFLAAPVLAYIHTHQLYLAVHGH